MILPSKIKLSEISYLSKSLILLLYRAGFQLLFTKNISSYPSPVKSQVWTILADQPSAEYTRFSCAINLP